MEKRFIEIKGIGIPNKGAELMLLAILEKVGEAFPKHYFCSEPASEFYPRARYGLFQRTGFVFRNYYIEWSPFARLVPSRIRDRYGLVTEDQVDVIVDASGFAYGDQWGAAKARARLGKRIRKWKKQGKKIVLLPQAFGPFADKDIRLEMTSILEYADLVFARDKQSLSYLDELLPGKALLSPDFTNLVVARPVPDRYKQYAGRPCLIPNHKMITMVKGNQGYAKSMANCLELMQEAGEEPFVLIHEGEDDIRLGEEIAGHLRRKVDILIPDDALTIKAIIGQCSFVVSSRFHGLVSALSQGIPVVATGWSHKYAELLNDYDMEEFLYKNNGSSSMLAMVKRLMIAGEIEKAKMHVENKVGIEKSKSIDMWAKVVEIIKN